MRLVLESVFPWPRRRHTQWLLTDALFSRPVLSDSLRPHRRKPTRLLCPWDSPGKNTGVGCHSLLQRICLTQGLNLGLPRCRQTLYHLSHQGSPSDSLIHSSLHLLFFWIEFNTSSAGMLVQKISVCHTKSIQKQAFEGSLVLLSRQPRRAAAQTASRAAGCDSGTVSTPAGEPEALPDAGMRPA